MHCWHQRSKELWSVLTQLRTISAGKLTFKSCLAHVCKPLAVGAPPLTPRSHCRHSESRRQRHGRTCVLYALVIHVTRVLMSP